MPAHHQKKLTTADATDSSGEQPAPGLSEQQQAHQSTFTNNDGICVQSNGGSTLNIDLAVGITQQDFIAATADLLL